MHLRFFTSKKPLRFGIRLRMLLVTFAVSSLFVLYIALSTERQAERDRVHLREEMHLVAALSGARLDDHLGDIRQWLTALGGTMPLDPADASRNDATLRKLATQLPDNLSDISIWSADGNNIGSSSPTAPAMRTNVSDRAFFTDALHGPSLAFEAPVHLQQDGEWVAVFALRLVRDNQPTAVLSVSSRLLTLPRLLDPEGALPAGAVVTLIDTNGRIVTRSPEPERWIGQFAQIDRAGLLRRFAEGHGSTDLVALDGIRRVFGFARSRSRSLLVYVGIPVDTALAASHKSAQQSLALGVGLLIAGLVISAWVASRIARPLRQLSADAKLFGEGHFDHRSPVRTGSEMGMLAHTLNRMAAALQERTAAARQSAERLSLALEGSEQALFDWDIATNRVYYSARASVLRGGPNMETEVSPDDMRAFVHPDDIDRVLAALNEAIRGTVAVYEAEFRVLHADGTWIWLRSRGRVVERDAEGRALRLVGTDADISKRKAAEEELRQRAEFDVLTGLPNRALFNDRLAAAVDRAARSGKALALLFLDLDDFKAVNDSRGHEAGDELLKVAAKRLLGSVRTVDTVARLAGDEFTVILENLSDPTDADGVAAKLVDAMREPVRLGSGSVLVTVSVGVAVLGFAEIDPASLMRRADKALYEAKRRGRNRYAVSRAASAVV